VNTAGSTSEKRAKLRMPLLQRNFAVYEV
jgi:hypothetical protein